MELRPRHDPIPPPCNEQLCFQLLSKRETTVRFVAACRAVAIVAASAALYYFKYLT